MSTEPSPAPESDVDHETDSADRPKDKALGKGAALGAALGGGGGSGLQRPPFMDPPAPESDEPEAQPDTAETTDPTEDHEPTQAPVSVPQPEDAGDADAEESTRPPTSTLRYGTPSELYSSFPEVKHMTMHRPRDGESVKDYLYRLRSSTTPEETVTFTAFAAQPAMAVWWAYGCLRTMADTLSPEDRGLMEMIAMWSGNPDNTNRWRVMKASLYAPQLTPVGHLGLAVGWSGGSVAPNDPAPVPAWRTPRAVNTAVLSSIAHISLQERSRSLARFIDLAGKMFDVY